ncbi:MAG: hypothetical protein AAF685_02675 [Cyanobacteria bacterium P01_C01_bin.89]
MDSAGSVPRSEDPPSPLPAGLIVNCVGTAIAVVTLSLPTMAITYYSGGAADTSSEPVRIPAAETQKPVSP